VDYDWVGYVDRRRSTNKYVFRLFGRVVSWIDMKDLGATMFILGMEIKKG
jgi:hypothetical protein